MKNSAADVDSLQCSVCVTVQVAMLNQGISINSAAKLLEFLITPFNSCSAYFFEVQDGNQNHRYHTRPYESA